jgi:hypothetical protein
MASDVLVGTSMRAQRSEGILLRRAPTPARLALAQGVYYLITGVWPLANIKSFQAVTGPKRDLWLVKTVGVLIAVIGGTLTLGGGGRRRTTTEIGALGAGSAAGLAGVDTVYATNGRISKIYLLDALIEAWLFVSWIIAARREWRARRGWGLGRIAPWRR